MRSSPLRSTAGARPPLDLPNLPRTSLAGRGGRAAPGGGCGRRQALPVALPQVPPAGSLRGPRAGSRDPGPVRSGSGRSSRARVPALRTAGDREDLDGADPRQDGQLRVRPHPRTLARATSASPFATASTWTSSRSTRPRTAASTTRVTSARRRPPPRFRGARRSTSSTRRRGCRGRPSTRC